VCRNLWGETRGSESVQKEKSREKRRELGILHPQGTEGQRTERQKKTATPRCQGARVSKKRGKAYEQKKPAWMRGNQGGENKKREKEAGMGKEKF